MNYVEKALDGVYNVFNVNAATLSGAIDIIVVPQEDGTLKSTPFHVRFGKMQSFAADEKIVSIFVNDELIDLKMKLGKAGEAYFLEDLPEDELDSVQKEVPKKGSNTLPSSSSLDSKLDSVTNESEDLSQWLAVNEGPTDKIASAATITTKEPGQTDSLVPNPDSVVVTSSTVSTAATTTTTTTATPVPPPPTWQWSWGMFPTKLFRKGSTNSTTTTTTTAPTTPGPSTESPGAIRTSSDKIEDKDPSLLPTTTTTTTATTTTTVDDDPLIVGTTPIFAATDDPETATPALSTTTTPIPIPTTTTTTTTNNNNSGGGGGEGGGSLSTSLSPPKSTTDMIPPGKGVVVGGGGGGGYSSPIIPLESITNLQNAKIKVEYSRCGQYLGNSVEEIQAKLLEGYKETDMIFNEHRLSSIDISKDPSLLFHPHLLIKLQNQIYPMSIGVIQMMYLMAFQQGFLPPDTLALLALSNPSLSFKLTPPPTPTPLPSLLPGSSASDKKWWRRWGGGGPSSTLPNPTHSLKEKDLVEALSPKPLPSTTTTTTTSHSAPGSASVSLPTSPVTKRAKRTFKTLRPSSEDLKRMGLKPGSNPIRFRISSFRGQAEVRAHVFLWEKDSKIVISDIDGTITKSDVFGQILPFLGRDWSHSGIVKLYSTIKQNNYHVLYLSARAIGQANSTRGYVTSLKQGEEMMPMGPVFLSPTRLLSSFNQEVIQRTPQKFKIECLKDVQSLFPGNSQPFYAGFGNRMTDVISYEAVGIPNGKIFTINPKGEISIAKSAVTKSFKTLNELVEHMFPPNISPVVAEEWNNFNFWKPPPPSLDQ